MLNFQQSGEKMKKYLNILKKCPLFYGISEEELLRLLSCLGAVVEQFDKKYTVLREGDSARYIGIVLSGSVQIIQIDYFGNRNIITEIGTSELFGEAFACAEIEKMPVQIIANEPSEIMLIDSAHIIHTCSNACGFHPLYRGNTVPWGYLSHRGIVFYFDNSNNRGCL